MQKERARRSRVGMRIACAVAVGIIEIAALAPSARADVLWNTIDGDWGLGANWNTGTLPGAADLAVVNFATPTTQVPIAHVTSDVGTVAGVSVSNGNRLSVEPGGVLRVAGATNSTSELNVARGGTSGQFSMSGGVVNVGYQFFVARGAGSSAAFEMSDGRINVGTAFILAGSERSENPTTAMATGTQTGGTIRSSDFFSVAQSGVGRYDLSGGTVTAMEDFNVGDLGGNGTLNLSGTGVAGGRNVYVSKFPNSRGVVNQTGGRMTVGGFALVLAGSTTASGTYNLKGGVLDLGGGQLQRMTTTPPSAFNMTGGQLVNVSSIDFALDQEGGALSPGRSLGVGSVSVDDYTLGAAATLELDFASATSFDSVSVVFGHTVTLRGALVTHVNYTPVVGQQFKIIDSFDPTPVTGTFAGLPEGALFDSGNVRFRINYRSGSGPIIPGSDVVLTVVAVPEPGAAVVLALASGLCAARPRRRG